MSGDLGTNHVDESHIAAFADALKDEYYWNEPETNSPAVPSSPLPSPTPSRIRKVTALSDFAPVNVKVKKYVSLDFSEVDWVQHPSRRRRKDRSQLKRQDWLYILLRWPLLIFLLTFIAGQFGFYVLIRQLVNTKEWISAWRGKKGVLRKKLRGARNYEEWKAAARELDEYMGFNEWRTDDEDTFYDWKLIRKVHRSLKTLREKNDIRGLLGVLETCIRNNFAGVESSRLYSETYLGTKNLIESYYDEQERALECIRNSPELTNDEKKRFFKSANHNLGTTALCLSGGASFGYYHVGVVKAFLDSDMLPRVITGTSAGGLIAALVCTRTDAELRKLLVPELANNITACEEPFSVWIRRFWATGARFDSVSWARKATFFTRGSMTFKEAYLRTGRILNISVIPADRHSPTKLLNYITAPNTVIWTALLASAAVPGILNPVVLMHKLKDGSIAPWNWGSRFKDGSLRVDIPVQALNLYFNVTHPIVSQVNPHVHLFFFAPRGSAGKPVAHRKSKGWRGNFLLSAAEQWLKHELTKNFKVIRDLELLPQLLGQDWSSVFLQRFDGSVTIWPRTRFRDWSRILSDPDPPELERMINVGQLVTWPKLHMIGNRTRIEKQIFLGRQAVRRPHSRGAAPRVRGTDMTGRVQEAVPEPITGTHLKVLPSRDPDDNLPISIDTDAEQAYADAQHMPSTRLGRFHRRNHSPSPLSSRDGSRRRQTSVLFNASTPNLRLTPDPPPSARITGLRNTQEFFNRLRARSFQALTSPFTSTQPLQRFPTGSSKGNSPGWSSESSSENEDLLSPNWSPSIRQSFLGAAIDLDADEPYFEDDEGGAGEEEGSL